MNKLTQERLKELFYYDRHTGYFIRRSTRGGQKKGTFAGSDQGEGYLRIRIDGERYLSHHLAWLYVYGELPVCEMDHINRNRSDNSIKNLRLADREINTRNVGVRKDNKTGIAGVSWCNTHYKWIAYISKGVKLGYFKDFFEACCARKSAEKTLGYM